MNTQHDELDPAQRAVMRSLLLDHARRDAHEAPARASRQRIMGVVAGISGLCAITVGALSISFIGNPISPAPADPVSPTPAVSTHIVGGYEVQEAGGTTLFAATATIQMDALLIGTVRLQDGCFVAGSSDARTTPLIFPKGTRLSADGESAEVPGVGTVTDGDAIRGGGGLVPEVGITGHCAQGGDVIMWQSAAEDPPG
jgi:hypothetical protein